MKSIKLRYYLRALGLGIVVTSLILGISHANADTGTASMTDEQVKKRALELGMVDGNSLVLSDLREDISKEDMEDVVQESETDKMPESEKMIESEEIQDDVIMEGTELTPETFETGDNPEAEDDPETEEIQDTEDISDTEIDSDIVTFQIESGENSYAVSKRLADLGLIEDAWDFDDYLCDNGYSRFVRVGTYKIVKGTSEEEIAEIITGKH